MLKIDAHQHFWNVGVSDYVWLGNPGVEPLRRTWEPDELEPQLQAAGMNYTVLVQCENSYVDTEYMFNIAAEREWVAGVVGWVPLDQPEEADRKLKEFTQNPYFKGMRHLIHDEPDPDWVIRPEVIEGLRVLASYDLSFDVVAVFPNHLKHVPLLAEKVPGLRMVIDHLAKPPIADRGWEPWAEQMARAAEYPQVHAKISGLNTAADWDSWTAEDLKPYIDFVIDRFGAERCMFGGDWPVATLAGNYERVVRETARALEGYSEQQLEQIWGKTAERFYKLELR